MPNESSVALQWAHAWFRAEAARSVCGSFTPPAVAVCFWGNRSAADPSGKHAVMSMIFATGVVVRPVWVEERAACAGATSANVTLDIEFGHRWALPRLWPYCFYTWGSAMKLKTVPAPPPSTVSHESCVHSVANISNATSDHPHYRQHQRAHLPHQPPLLAIGLGGLARTLTHPLVYKPLRGHVVDGLGAHARTAVFGALRLTDDRVITPFANRYVRTPLVMSLFTRGVLSIQAHCNHCALCTQGQHVERAGGRDGGARLPRGGCTGCGGARGWRGGAASV